MDDQHQDSKISSDQILSVRNLDCFGADNFADYKFEDLRGDDVQGGNDAGKDSLDSEEKKSIGSDSDREVMSETSDATARVTDSQSDVSDTDDSKSSCGSEPNSRPLNVRIKSLDEVPSETVHETSSNSSLDSPQHNHILPPPPQHLSTTGRSRELGIVVSPGDSKQHCINGNEAKVLNYDHVNSKNNINRGIGRSVNSTMVQDDNSKYFTVIHDVPAPQGGPCKKCPKMQFAGLQEWWKVQQNLAPRTRQYVRISLVVLASAFILLAIFLLARLPNSPNDVLRPFMYDLPPDDAFRPAPTMPWGGPGDDPQSLQNIGADVPPMKEQDFHDSYPETFIRPAPLPSLRQAAVKKHIMPPSNSHPLDNSDFQLENARRLKMSKLSRNTTYADRALKVALELVKDTVDKERKEMEGKEANIWAEGATPLRILLVSTWRSGSTFLGQVLQQHPGVFQHYEPFSYMGVRQIRSGTDAFQSQQLLHRLLDCRFKGQDQYLNYTRQHPVDMSGHNRRIWKPCKFNDFLDVCSNSTFLTESCNMFPIQLVKTVRLRLNLTQLFLGENRLNAKVVFLVRDPRATMNSRLSSVDWCSSNPDCSSPEVLCSDLKEDLKVSAAFERLFPNSFIRIRYEDLANDPQKQVKNLLNFLGMEYTKELAQFVKSHTESDVEAPWSVARKSAARVDRWKENLTGEQVNQIEKVCKPVLEKLNYQIQN